MNGTFKGKGVEGGSDCIFLAGFVVSGPIREGRYLCMFLGVILATSMDFGQAIPGCEGRGRVVPPSRHCVRVGCVCGESLLRGDQENDGGTIQ